MKSNPIDNYNRIKSNPIDNYNRSVEPKVGVMNWVNKKKIITQKKTNNIDNLFFPEKVTLWVGCNVRTVVLLRSFNCYF